MEKKRNLSKNKNLKVIPLGGVEDINRNCYVVEYGKDIVVVDMGFSFPDEMQFGVDYLIPDVSYLKSNKKRIVGIVLTHAHLDHIGAIPYVVKDLDFPPIYGRNFTIKFLEDKLREFGLHNKVKLNVVEPSTDVNLNSFTARWVPVTHSIPQSSCILLKTPVGKVFYSGDYKFDDHPVNEPKPDYEQFKQIGKSGVDLALMDSTNVYFEGKSKSETEISQILEKIIKNARGRVLVATFASLGTRIYSLIEIAKKYDKKIVVTGRSMKTMISLLRKINYISVTDKMFLSEKSIGSVPDDKLLVLCTGTQGEEMAALSRIARNEHSNIKVKETDTVILSSSIVPGNQIAVQRLIDSLLGLGAKVIHQSFMDVHTSGHGYQEDMKQMYELIKPRYVMPVHGWPSFIHEAAFLLNKWGMKKKNILVPSTGQEFILSEKSGIWAQGKKHLCKEICVDGNYVTEIDEDDIDERYRLAEYGVISVFLKFNQAHKMIGNPVLLFKGFDFSKSRGVAEGDIINQVKKIYYSWYDGKVSSSKRDVNKLKKNISKRLDRFIDRKIGKRPVIGVAVSVT